MERKYMTVMSRVEHRETVIKVSNIDSVAMNSGGSKFLIFFKSFGGSKSVGFTRHSYTLKATEKCHTLEAFIIRHLS